MITAVIMAGGRGERLWPRSTTDMPKQFQCFVGNTTLLQQAFARVSSLVPPSQVFVVTGRQHAQMTRLQLPQVPQENVIVEPIGRDTAPCIGLAAVHIQKKYPESIMIVVPADHYVGCNEEFMSTLSAAVEAAQSEPVLVTIGMKPTRPETGYGYVQVGAKKHLVANQWAHDVVRFIEKPQLEKALEMCQSDDHLWNSGMFVWRTEVILKSMAMHLPELHSGLEEIGGAIGAPEESDVVGRTFPLLPKISIDYGVMEKADRVLVIPASFNWDDLGNWVAVERAAQGSDERGNNVSGRVGIIDAKNCVIQDDEGVTVAIGVQDLVVVRSKEALLVCSKERVQDVKKAVVLAEGLCSDTCFETEEYRVVDKPWGREIWWAVTEAYVGKILEVKAGHSLSLQYHQRKLETMFFQRGRGTLVLNGAERTIRQGMAVTIRPGTLHKIVAESDLTILEVSTTELDDVVRVQDSYGRAQTSPKVTASRQE
ncbi:MAG: NTP transferase domain-containing protein [Selenomonadales bacterium]|nr:NTP transferase domain-containing protein [Selenomonadales bacterium]